MAVVAGVDSSTQSTKIVFRDADTGAHVYAASRPHIGANAKDGRSEQDPLAWERAMRECLDEAAHLDVVAISIAAQQHGMVVTDADGLPLRPAKLWNDTESAPDATRLLDVLGAEAWATRTGSVPVAALTITKLAWLARTEPQHRVGRVLLPHDWLTHRLTGRFTTDRGDASGTGYWSPTDGWCADLLALAGPYDVSMLPDVLGPSEAAGRWGDIVLGAGTGDNMAAALGLGARPGDLVLSLGTSGVASRVSGSPTADPSGTVAGFADATGAFLPLVCTLNAMQVTDWVAALFGQPLDDLALQGPPGSAGVVLIPFLSGERTPNHPEARGVLGGLSLHGEPSHIARAAVEGIVASLLEAADRLPPGGGRVILTGGGAKSAAVRSVVADVCERQVHVVDAAEAVASGAAVQAAAALHGADPGDIARAWAPDVAVVLEPGHDPAGVRSAYRAALPRSIGT